jgi:hypothetical protein
MYFLSNQTKQRKYENKKSIFAVNKPKAPKLILKVENARKTSKTPRNSQTLPNFPIFTNQINAQNLKPTYK